ncbi:MAG: universal stress protein, partial [Staphylococcus sp.]|nr:universal stress protein [Staphylococcus sp.]
NSGEFQAIVLGTRGLNSLQEMVLGSVSHKVAKRSEIPVVIVK